MRQKLTDELRLEDLFNYIRDRAPSNKEINDRAPKNPYWRK